MEVEKCSKVIFTNGWLAKYCINAAERIEKRDE